MRTVAHPAPGVPARGTPGARGAASPSATAHAFTYGMDRAFLYALPVAVLAFLLSFLMREVRLRSTVGPGGGPEVPAEPTFG